MIDYDNNEIAFYKYVESCRQKIKDLLFDNNEIKSGSVIMKELVNEGKIDNYTTVSDAIKIHRNNLIDIKLNHTMRIVNNVNKIAQKLNLNIDFVQVLKLSALLHDIARFPQAVNSNSFLDRECRIFNGDSHAEYGYKMLYINNMFGYFDIDKKYRFALASAVRYHQIPVVTGDLALTFNNTSQLNTEKLTGNENLNECEKVIVAALVQMVKDVDMLDILYQHITGEFPVIKSSIKVNLRGETIDSISNKFGMAKEGILSYNGLDDNKLVNVSSINIPVSNIDLKKLEVPIDIKNKFFNNEYIDLKELQNRRDYTFIAGMWWRLNHFLNNINFVSNLEILEENRLLEKIYNMYPDEYKFLVKDAFEYAHDELLSKRIIENKGKVYVMK